MGEVSIEALTDATFEIEKGEICVIVGASGAGKTTLLNILGGMDTLTEGRVLLDGKEISKYNKKELTDVYKRQACNPTAADRPLAKRRHNCIRSSRRRR